MPGIESSFYVNRQALSYFGCAKCDKTLTTTVGPVLQLRIGTVTVNSPRIDHNDGMS